MFSPNGLLHHFSFFDKCPFLCRCLFLPKEGISSWERRLLWNKIVVYIEQRKNGKAKNEKTTKHKETEDLSCSSLRRSSWKSGWVSPACRSFISLGAVVFLGTVPCVEVVLLDVGDDGVWEQVFDALPLAQCSPDIRGAELILHGLPDQVNVVLVPLQDGWTWDVFLWVVTRPAHTHHAKLLHYFLDMCVFPEVGGLEALQEVCPAEELQLRHSWKNKGGSLQGYRRVTASKDNIIFHLKRAKNAFLGVYWEVSRLHCVHD